MKSIAVLALGVSLLCALGCKKPEKPDLQKFVMSVPQCPEEMLVVVGPDGHPQCVPMKSGLTLNPGESASIESHDGLHYNLGSGGVVTSVTVPLDSDIWRPIKDAPRDGTIIEIKNDYGVAPTYGLFHWVKNSVNVNQGGTWTDAQNENKGIYGDGEYLTWRPYAGDVKAYMDPTHGQQNSVKYWCDAMHLRYDAKKDACVQ